MTFASKLEVPLLQAADLLAWQSTKYAKDFLHPRMHGEQPKRPPRKDFQSLMKHDHSFMHMEIKDGKKSSMGIEIWPLSERSQMSANMTIDNDGPIIFLRQGSDPTPIIPVDKTRGPVLGGAKMTYVAFEGMVQRPFALAFDEPRLFEALSRLMAATVNYENSHIVPLFHAETISLETNTSGATGLRIKLKDGASIAFQLDDAVLAKLKDQIEKSED